LSPESLMTNGRSGAAAAAARASSAVPVGPTKAKASRAAQYRSARTVACSRTAASSVPETTTAAALRGSSAHA
jgi:hypothetical protein